MEDLKYKINGKIFNFSDPNEDGEVSEFAHIRISDNADMEQVINCENLSYIQWQGESKATLSPMSMTQINVEEKFGDTREALEYMFKIKEIEFEYVGQLD